MPTCLNVTETHLDIDFLVIGQFFVISVTSYVGFLYQSKIKKNSLTICLFITMFAQLRRFFGKKRKTYF